MNVMLYKILTIISLSFFSSGLFAQDPPPSDGGAGDIRKILGDKVDEIRKGRGDNEGGKDAPGSDVPSRGRFSSEPKTEGDKGEDKSTDKNSKGKKLGDGDSDDKKEEDKEERRSKAKDDEEEYFYSNRAALPPAKIFGQQFFRDKSISLFQTSSKIEALESYVLDAGDELSVTVWGDANYSGVFKVTDDGYVDFTTEMISIPRLYVKEMSFGNAKKAIGRLFGQYIDLKGPNTQLAINLNYKRTIVVNIAGEVFNPGSYVIPATNTAFNALVAANGPSQIGTVRKIQVISKEKAPKTLDVYKFIKDPSPKEEFYLSNGDFIYVPLAERVVMIDGAIKRPFEYELVSGENLIKLIEYAGGLQPDAYKNNIQLTRFTNDEEVLIDINLADLMKNKRDFTLLDGDRISIAPILQSYTNFVSVTGAVKLAGQFELENKDTRLRDVLNKAGILGSARLDRFYVIRVKDDLSKEYLKLSLDNVLKGDVNENIVLRPFDEIRIEPKSRFRNDYSIKVHGAVRDPEIIVYSPNLTVKDAVFLCGGLKEEAANNRIEISRIVKGNNERTQVIVKTIAIDDDLALDDDHLLEPFDQIFVRSAAEFELQRNVVISGEVRYPGIYSLLDKREKLSSLLIRAGGPTESAFLEGAKMNRKEEDLGDVLLDARKVYEDPSSNFNYILKEGDSIFIPKMKDLVTIKGAVNYPPIDSGFVERVNVPFHDNQNAMYYVNEYAAGVNRVKDGRNRLIYVTHPNGKITKTKSFLFFKKYPDVSPGSIVSVEKKQKKPPRERRPFSFAQAAQILPVVIQQTTAALTLYFLVRNIVTQP